MPFNKNHLSNILFQQSIPLIEYILKDISEKYNLNLEELEKEYLTIFKTNKKRNTNKKGRKNGYSFFLSDKEVDKDLKLRFPDMKFGDLSKEKGKVWRAMSKIDKEKYKTKADNFNLDIMKLKIKVEEIN